MGMLNRIVTMTKAAANNMLDKLENPKLLMGQYLRDMEQQIDHMKQVIVSQKAKQHMFESKLTQIKEQISYYVQQAEQAITSGNEVGARTALEAKLAYELEQERLISTQSEVERSLVELDMKLQSLQEEKTRLEEKRKELDQRLDKVQTYGGMNSYTENNTFSQHFDRIEKSIMEMEARQEISSNPYYHYNGHAATAASMDAQHQMMKEKVDAELQQLMQKQAEK